MNPTRLKAAWLVSFLVLVLLMISVGGVTRLTRSGLSIVEWNPVVGMIPPLSQQDWQTQFEMYQKTPEFIHVNSHFTLAEYKKIFIWEYAHRVLGRVLFLFTLLPGLWLWRKKIVEGRLVFLLSSLIALQGLIGWLMVKSGLNKLPHVSPYLLALHFFSALIVLMTAYYFLSKMRPSFEVHATKASRRLFLALGVVLVLQIFYGCLTSGLKAGFAFNTFPLMGSSFLPPLGLNLTPVWLNLFENPITVQWIHRWLGVSTFFLVLLSGYVSVKQARSGGRGPFVHLMGITTTQALLGIVTLVTGVPIWLAALHQFVAALIVLGYCNIVFRMRTVAVPNVVDSNVQENLIRVGEIKYQ